MKSGFQNFFILFDLRKVVKTTLHARDPLLRGEGREETMGLPGEVGG